MVKRILIDAVHPEEVRVVVASDSRLEEFDFETSSKKQIKSNIYLGKVTRVEPSLQAAFVEYGGNKQGFLPFAEIHFDYYQIPVADKERLAAAIAAAEAEEAAHRETEAAARIAERERKSEVIAADAIDNTVPAEIGVEDFSSGDYPPSETVDITKQAEAVPAEYNAEYEKRSEIISPEMPFSDPAISEPAEVRSTGESSEESPEGLEIAGDDDIAEVRRGRSSIYRQYSQYKIQEVIKRNQIVLVQVIKEERGNKGASLTTYISLAGRYCVLMPNTDRQGGVSRRIMNVEDRKRLKSIVSSLNIAKGMSMIIRTAGIDRDEQEIKADYEYLVSIWSDIRKRTLNSEAPSLIYEDGNLIKRSLRDLYRADVDEIMVEGKDGYKSAREFMEAMAPEHVHKVMEYREATPIFRKYSIDKQLDELHENRAYLRSGGYIVITPTEALVSIDVNSGRSTRGRSIEETAVRTNMEAAEEIARQLRLRDLAGLVVIDFIDMRELRNRRSVERALKEALRLDRAKIQVGRISIFGLLEMSRQRLRSSIVEAHTTTCPHCNGTGLVRSDESIAIMLLRAIENEANREYRGNEIKLKTSSQAALFLLNNKRQEIAQIEKNSGVRVVIEQDFGLTGVQYSVDKPGFRKKRDWYRQEQSEYSAVPDNAESTDIGQESTQATTTTSSAEISENVESNGQVPESQSDYKSSDNRYDNRYNGRRRRNNNGRRGGGGYKRNYEDRSGGEPAGSLVQEVIDSSGNNMKRGTIGATGDDSGKTSDMGSRTRRRPSRGDGPSGRRRGGRRPYSSYEQRDQNDMRESENQPAQTQETPFSEITQDNKPSEAPSGDIAIVNVPIPVIEETSEAKSKLKGLWRKMTQG